ncbi:MAG: serine/threonine protein kinase [Bacteroides sp.]|nr:serine/threonine protein kinase [Bacteroides sp.]
MQLTPNTELQSGKYRIIRVLGQGGFGITYLAENILLTKFIAIKEFFPKDFCGRINTSHLAIGTQNNAETVAKLKDRFLKEARNIAKLDHPGIVKIHDVFEENNTAYYVMDYIKGENLNEMVKRNGPLTEAKAVEYIRKVGDALDYIHSRNMTHFDVKPANIVVRRSDDMPILIDFGLSKQYDTHGDATSTLMQGVSNSYSPIELYTPGSLSNFSPQTDIYSLGATLYYLLTSMTPPAASEVAENGLTFPTSISRKIVNATTQAMSLSRSKRQLSISVFLADMTRVCQADSSTNISDKEVTSLINTSPTKPQISTKLSNSDINNSNSKQSIPQATKENRSSLIWIISVIVITVGIFIWLNNNNDEVSQSLDSTSENTVEIIEEPVTSHAQITTENPTPTHTATPSFQDTYHPTKDCEIRYIDESVGGRIYVPTYLLQNYTEDNGWKIYYNGDSDLRFRAIGTGENPIETIDRFLSQGSHNYEVAKSGYAVRSCVHGNRIYYSRANKIGNYVYIFIYSVPLADKANAEIYNYLTSQISKNLAF